MKHRPVTLITLAALAGTALAAPSPRDRAWVDQRVAEWQPTASERAWEGIGWAKDLREALRLGKGSGRPVFLFTHDGRLGVGRC